MSSSLQVKNGDDMNDDVDEMIQKCEALLELSKLYQSSGVTASRLQHVIPQVFAALQMRCTVLMGPNVLFFDFDLPATAASGGLKFHKSRIVANKAPSTDIDLHEAVQLLLEDICANPTSYSSEKLHTQVKALQTRPGCFPIYITALAWILVAAFVGSLYLRVPWGVSALSATGGVISFVLFALLPAIKPSFVPIRDFFASFCVGLLARGAASFELIDLGCIVFGAVLGIVPMVPGSALTIGAIDIMAGNSTINGVATFVLGLLQAFLQGIGLWCGFYVGGQWGPSYTIPDDLVCNQDLISDWWLFLFAPMQWASWAVLLNVPVQRWPIYFGSGATMFAIWYGLSYTNAPSDFQNLAGSFFVGIYGFAVEYATGHASIGVFVFGFFLQVPGASAVVAVWVSLYNQTDGYASHATLVALEIGIGLYFAYALFFAFLPQKPMETSSMSTSTSKSEGSNNDDDDNRTRSWRDAGNTVSKDTVIFV